MINAEGNWDKCRVRDAITEADAELILDMELPIQGRSDTYIWPHSKDGNPRARSVYHKMRELQQQLPVTN